MKTKYILVLASVSYFIFLLILTPAANIIPLLNNKSTGITMSGISGSLWAGSVDKMNLKNQTIQSLAWSLNPFSLLLANLSTDIEASVKGQLITSQVDYALFSEVTSLNNLHSSINASELKELLKLPLGEFSGIIDIDLSNVTLAAKKLPLINGLINWNNATLTLSEKIAFGQVSLKLNSADNGDLIGKLNNTQGELSIVGDVKVLTNNKYTIDIKLTPRANASSELKSILSLIAPRKVKSSHIIQRTGSLHDLGIRL